jgi:ubiquinone/menaquinone biosynthesis C-methylase UbiE
LPEGGGKRILEVGPGEGRDLQFLSGTGSQVTGIDISPRSLSISRDCCPECNLSLMNGSTLGFADSVFDVVFSRTLLMHVEKQLFLKECRRVLKPGGKAIFVEPLKLNPLLLPYRAAFSSGRRVGPEYLKAGDLTGMRDIFGTVRIWYFYLFSVIGAPLTAVAPGARTLFVPLEWADRLLLRVLPFLRHFCWISVIECTK